MSETQDHSHRVIVEDLSAEDALEVRDLIEDAGIKSEVVRVE